MHISDRYSREYKPSAIVFKKYKTYKSLTKDYYRATEIYRILNYIDESFAYSYLNYRNPLLFNKFLKGFFKFETFFRSNFNYIFAKDFILEPKEIPKMRKLLNKYNVIFEYENKTNQNFWKMAQKHTDLFKSL